MGEFPRKSDGRRVFTVERAPILRNTRFQFAGSWAGTWVAHDTASSALASQESEHEPRLPLDTPTLRKLRHLRRRRPSAAYLACPASLG
jgi:hypothetical protein